jgi:hypothetical protein
MIVPSRWIRQWITFTHLKTGKEPGKITMMSLLVADHSVPGGLRPNKNLMAPNADQASEEAPGHYRRVTYDAWCQLEMLYGADGPAIAVVSLSHLPSLLSLICFHSRGAFPTMTSPAGECSKTSRTLTSIYCQSPSCQTNPWRRRRGSWVGSLGRRLPLLLPKTLSPRLAAETRSDHKAA